MSDKAHLPMLAKSWDPNKTVYPCLVQPKLDGVRCLAHVGEDGNVTLRSRDDKPIPMDHVRRAVEDLRLPPGTILDGELYKHGLPFQELSGHVRRELHDERKLSIPYVVYDVMRGPGGVHTRPYAERHAWLEMNVPVTAVLQSVENLEATSAETVQGAERAFVEAGYEGAMVRTQGHVKATKKNPEPTPVPDYYQAAFYGHSRRSDFLQKVKSFEDAEAVIIGVEEEVDLAGIPKGRTGKFVMRTPDGTTFRASGLTDAMKADSWANRDRYIGQLATFKYFGTSTDGVPRHPNFKALRPEGALDAAV